MTGFDAQFPYLVTPIDADGEIKTQVLGRLCEDLITAGVHGLTQLTREEYGIRTAAVERVRKTAM